MTDTEGRRWRNIMLRIVGNAPLLVRNYCQVCCGLRGKRPLTKEEKFRLALYWMPEGRIYIPPAYRQFYRVQE